MVDHGRDDDEASDEECVKEHKKRCKRELRSVIKEYLD